MADLTQAIGLNPSSIDGAFGDKHDLFSRAAKRYMETRVQYATKAREEATLEKVVCALFDNTVAFLTMPGHPPTCMTLAGTVGSTVDATPARDLMTGIRKQNERDEGTLLTGAKRGESYPRTSTRMTIQGICRRLSPVYPST
jgi:AcrR family transcriptional regulator